MMKDGRVCVFCQNRERVRREKKPSKNLVFPFPFS
jgi:hypothetical protein